MNTVAINSTYNAVEGRNCTIFCVTDTLNSGVSFQHPPGTIVGACPFPGRKCIHGSYRISQLLLERKTTLTISNYLKNRDDGIWLCNYRRISSVPLYLNATSKWWNINIPKKPYQIGLIIRTSLQLH